MQQRIEELCRALEATTIDATQLKNDVCLSTARLQHHIAQCRRRLGMFRAIDGVDAIVSIEEELLRKLLSQTLESGVAEECASDVVDILAAKGEITFANIRTLDADPAVDAYLQAAKQQFHVHPSAIRDRIRRDGATIGVAALLHAEIDQKEERFIFFTGNPHRKALSNRGLRLLKQIERAVKDYACRVCNLPADALDWPGNRALPGLPAVEDPAV